MDKKAFLKYLGFTGLALGLVFAILPFVNSLKPPASAHYNLPRYDKRLLTPGRLTSWSLRDGFGSKPDESYWVYLIYAVSTDEFCIWGVPARDGKIGMPDLKWWRPMYYCNDFGLDPSKTFFHCNDPDTPSWWVKRWRWSLDGEAFDKVYSENMTEYNYTIEGNYIVLGTKRR